MKLESVTIGPPNSVTVRTPPRLGPFAPSWGSDLVFGSDVGSGVSLVRLLFTRRNNGTDEEEDKGDNQEKGKEKQSYDGNEDDVDNDDDVDDDDKAHGIKGTKV